ncbi:MAG: hypothetical protein ACTH30_15235 [Leucobacter sp.]
MSTFQCSPQQLRNAATNAATIGSAIAAHPVYQIRSGDLGHAGVAGALDAFRSGWAAELQLRAQATQQAAQLLNGAAADTERVDQLLANAASRLGTGR